MHESYASYILCIFTIFICFVMIYTIFTNLFFVFCLLFLFIFNMVLEPQPWPSIVVPVTMNTAHRHSTRSQSTCLVCSDGAKNLGQGARLKVKN